MKKISKFYYFNLQMFSMNVHQNILHINREMQTSKHSMRLSYKLVPIQNQLNLES